MPADHTNRFSNRVEDYVKYRPDYPIEIMDWLRETVGLPAKAVVADVGSGTGISSEMFLKEGFEVHAVEPNKEMREKATELLHHYPAYHEQDGTAERTGLANDSVAAIIAGQAFHWFRPAETRTEWLRIGTPGAITVLMWNERLTSNAFEKAYDELIIRHATDYVQVDHRNISPDKIAAFFHPATVMEKVFKHRQVFDVEGLTGRLLSSSYMPAVGDPGFDAMLADVSALFDRYQQEGTITIHYDTKVYAGRLDGLD